MNFLKQIFNKMGRTGVIIVLLFVILLAYKLIRRENREKNAAYTKGISKGVKSGVRGNMRLYYTFQIDGQIYNGNVSDEFCGVCVGCCKLGDTVIVRFQSDDPENNDLVVKLPDGATLE